MNWVAPIKDPETLKIYKDALLKADVKYYIMFEIGVGTGLQLLDILELKIGDVRNRDSLKVTIGIHEAEREFRFPPKLKEVIAAFVEGKSDDEYLFRGRRAGESLTREQAYRALKSISLSVGISSVGAQTMRKTFAWNYYKETGDIVYLQRLFNHASPSITLRFIGEKPNVEVPMKKMTTTENEKCRRDLCRNGDARIKAITDELNEIADKLMDPSMNDSFYGSVDCLLDRIEETLSVYHGTLNE